MKFHRDGADLFVPDGAELPGALERTTHLCVGAHQDDQEFMAYHGIAECFGRPDRWFTGVALTDGSGSARTGPYREFSDADMRRVRRREQRKAAYVGEYACQIQLDYPSSMAVDPTCGELVADLRAIFEIARPDAVYLHNPADKHNTHVAACLRALEALRALPPDRRPARVVGCEVWRDLDWLPDEDKVVLPVDSRESLAAALGGVFDSQLVGGKRYDLAVAGRRRANATLFESHAIDASTGLSWAVDLTAVMNGPPASTLEHTLELIDRFRDDVRARIERLDRPGSGGDPA